MSVVGSWFGGPSPSHRPSVHRASSHKSSHSARRDSSPKGYFVRPHQSPSRRGSEVKGYFVRPHSPDKHRERRKSETGSSIFGFGGGAERSERGGSPARSVHSTTTRGFASWLSGGGHRASSSYYKRRPRDGYIARLMHQIKRLWRNLLRYAKENPFKLVMLVIMPLVTGGALHGVLRSLGVQLPPGISKMMGGRDNDRHGSHGGGGGGGGGLDVGQLMNVAKMFM